MSSPFVARATNATTLLWVLSLFWSPNAAEAQGEGDAKADAAKPNIVFFMADDWSWPHAGVLGDPVVQTPNFDRVAREGVLFENAFVSTPSCTPSRLSILTGQHHWRLRKATVWAVRCARNSTSTRRCCRMPVIVSEDMGKAFGPANTRFAIATRSASDFAPSTQFIKDRKPGEPFCYWHGGQDPHRPYELNVGVEERHQLAEIEVPACLPDNETVRSDVADYLWEVQRFDREVGEVMARLEAMGELDNTIIVVSGDNGMPFPRCKATLYDQGTRVPLAVRWGARVRRRSQRFRLCQPVRSGTHIPGSGRAETVGPDDRSDTDADSGCRASPARLIPRGRLS